MLVCVFQQSEEISNGSKITHISNTMYSRAFKFLSIKLLDSRSQVVSGLEFDKSSQRV